MIKINMAVEASTHEELIEALKSAGPNVTSFYGEVVKPAVQANPEPTSVADEPEPAPEEPAGEPTPVYSKEEVRAELRKVMQTQGSEAMREILMKHGGKKLDEVDESTYPAIIADVKEALESAG